MPNTEFIKDQILVTKGVDPRTGNPSLVECIFVEYLAVPRKHGATVLDSVVRNQEGGKNYINSDNLANILYAEQVMARHHAARFGY